MSRALFLPLSEFYLALPVELAVLCEMATAQTPVKPGANKRPRSTPTLQTPQRPMKRVPIRDSDVVTGVRRLALEDSSTSSAVDEVQAPEYEADAEDQDTVTPGLAEATEGGCTQSHSVPWSNKELKLLTECILFHGTGDKWPTHHNTRFWKEAAQYVKVRAEATNQRSGMHSPMLRC